MSPETEVQQFILLPSAGLRVSGPLAQGQALTAQGDYLTNLAQVQDGPGAPNTFHLPNRPDVGIRVLDSIYDDGAKLVEMSLDTLSHLRVEQPGLRIIPVVYYQPTIAPQPMPRIDIGIGTRVAAIGGSIQTQFRVIAPNGQPIAGATVVVFTNYARRIGTSGQTNEAGEVTLRLEGVTRLQRLYVFPRLGYWPLLRRKVAWGGRLDLILNPIDLAFTDALKYFYGYAPDGAGAPVKVGVVDTGIGPHVDIQISGGRNTVTGENPNDYGDNGEGHGTHVAGILAACGQGTQGMRGVAPGVALYSYRVFAHGSGDASNFAIIKALESAVEDGCDLINMSLGGSPPDEALSDAIAYARTMGRVVIVAAGNDNRGPINFPASDPRSVAVSAMGRLGTFPLDSMEADEIRAPFGTDKNDGMASFSNIGPEIDLTGPGVGIISTFPGGYAVLDGTSMACPAATGMATRRLASRPDILGMPLDQARSDAAVQAILQAAQPLGFGPTYEGRGLAR